MTQNEIVELFRQHACILENQAQGPMLNDVIMELARLLADSRGKLSKQNFETLIHIGGVLFREGRNQFQARSDVDAIMKGSFRGQ